MTSGAFDDELLDACRDAQAFAVFFEVARQLGADRAFLDEFARAEIAAVLRAASLPARSAAGLRAKAELAERWTGPQNR